MRLLLDAGNTRLKWAHWRSGSILRSGALAHRGGDSDWPSLLDDCLGGEAGAGLTAILGLEVVGAGFREALMHWAAQRGLPVPRLLSADPRVFGLHSLYHEPRSLGVDRYALMAGARALGHERALIVGCGTAVTLDLLDAGGLHRGGLLLPGLTAMRDALLALPGIRGAQDGREDVLLARSTADGLASGCVQGLAAAISSLSRRLAQQAAASPCLLLTGGDAVKLLPHLDPGFELQADLLFLGMAACGDTPSDG